MESSMTSHQGLKIVIKMCDWIIKKHQRAFNYSVCVRVKDEGLDITGFATHILSSPFILLVSYLKAFSASLLPKIALLRSPARADIVCLFHKNIDFTSSLHKQFLNLGLPPCSNDWEMFAV